MIHSCFPACRSSDWSREAECLRDMARNNPGAAASLLRQAEAAERQAAWWRAETERCAREDEAFRNRAA
jgi:hypothetical protein